MSDLSRVRWQIEQALAGLAVAEAKCLTCGKPESECGNLYRCWDCKMQFCEFCVKDHFGTHHQPHPLTRTQLREILRRLATALRERCKADASDGEMAALYLGDETLKRLTPEKGEVP